MTTLGGSRRLSSLEFLEEGVLTITAINSFGEKQFDFVKLIFILGLFLLIFYQSILLMIEVSDGFRNTVQFHSKSRHQYLIRLIILITKQVTKDYLVFCGCILVIAVLKVSFISWETLLLPVIFFYSIVIIYFVLLILSVSNMLFSLVGCMFTIPMMLETYQHPKWLFLVCLVVVIQFYTPLGTFSRGEGS
jgi:hypothetical protein